MRSPPSSPRRARSCSCRSTGHVLKPLTTDLSAAQLIQLGWVKFRSSGGSAVHCRLGGDLGGGGHGSPSEDNPATLTMFLGDPPRSRRPTRSARAA